MKKNVKEKLSDALGVSKEILMDIPHITFAGNKEVYIENYKSIVEYTNSIIRLMITGGMLTIKGSELCVDKLRATDMFVSGNFISIEFKTL